MYQTLRPLLFRQDPETAHERAVRALAIAGMKPFSTILSALTHVAGLEHELFGLRFSNRVGLAAGFDKNACGLRGAEALGFGFVEAGTIVPRPQIGNDKPRVFRLTEDKAVINRYGFNSDGMSAALLNLINTGKLGIPVGINVGKNKSTKDEVAHEDYCACIKALYSHGDYFGVNVSSPNTPGLRNMQKREALEKLVRAVQTQIKECAKGNPPKPFLVKITSELLPEEEAGVAEVVSNHGASGLIIGNTMMNRVELVSNHRNESGGLSGAPIRKNALLAVRRMRKLLPKLPIIGVGGISSADDAKEMLDAGADLIQVYTGLVYEGPFLPYQINRGLKSKMT